MLEQTDRDGVVRNSILSMGSTYRLARLFSEVGGIRPVLPVCVIYGSFFH